jgi:hypothetical protein
VEFVERSRNHSDRIGSVHLQHLAVVGLVSPHETRIESNGRVCFLRPLTVSRVVDHPHNQISFPKSNDFSIPQTTHSNHNSLNFLKSKTNTLPSPPRVLLPISLRLLYIHHATLSSNPSIYTSISITITTTLTTHLATMACTLPCLKQFLAMFESGMLDGNTTASGGGYGYGSGSGSRKGTMRTDRSGSVALVEIARGAHGAAVRRSGTGTAITSNISRAATGAATTTTRHRPTSSSSDIELVLRPDHVFGDYSVASISTAAAADASSFVSDRSGAAMIIKKTQKWEVSRDGW